MADVLLHHHAQGLTDGVRAFADRLRAAGHTVTTPDSYDGNTFDSLDEGIGYAREVGFGTVLERGLEAGRDAPDGTVYGGFSLGVMQAQQLAQTRPGARGALFFHSCLPVAEFGEAWPPSVPVQVHAMDRDPFFVEDGDVDAARALVESTDDAELFLYPGEAHLFADESLDSYDAEAARLLEVRVLDFLARLSGG